LELQLTFHDINDASDISLLDDQILGWILNRIHAVNDLADLRQIQILHEIIIQYGSLDKFTGAAKREINAISCGY